MQRSAQLNSPMKEFTPKPEGNAQPRNIFPKSAKNRPATPHITEPDENAIEIQKGAHSVFIKNADLVIVSPIKANQIDIYDVKCNGCLKNYETIFKDMEAYGRILQIIMLVVTAGVLRSNLVVIYSHCKNVYLTCAKTASFSYLSIIFSQPLQKVSCKCVLENCHWNLLNSYFTIVNVLFVLLIVYDVRQMRSGSLRLSIWFTTMVAWLGGWPVLCLFMLMFGYKRGERGRSLLLINTLSAAILSPSGGAVYYFLIQIICFLIY
jgi:hypothetical protein